MRPKTLPAGACPVAMAGAMAAEAGVFHAGDFVACLAGALLLQIGANFANDYVHDQLEAQQITFTPADALSPEENAQCLRDNAGKALVTGKQAECYANEYIALHLSEVNDGKTYAQTSSEARAIEDRLEADDTITIQVTTLIIILLLIILIVVIAS